MIIIIMKMKMKKTMKIIKIKKIQNRSVRDRSGGNRSVRDRSGGNKLISYKNINFYKVS